jgi:outer membrane protein OmpA-like peptidoglycan-associated protein
MSSAPYPPFPPFPEFPPFPPFPPATGGAACGGCAATAPPAVAPAVAPAGVGVAGFAPAPASAPAAQPAPAPTPASPATPQPFPGSSQGNPLSMFFNFDSPALVDHTNEGQGVGQLAKLQTFATNAQAARTTAITINGFASPEGDAAHNAQLAHNRAVSVQQVLQPLLPGVAITLGVTGTLAGDPSQFPSLRRADVFVTAHA